MSAATGRALRGTGQEVPFREAPRAAAARPRRWILDPARSPLALQEPLRSRNPRETDWERPQWRSGTEGDEQPGRLHRRTYAAPPSVLTSHSPRRLIAVRVRSDDPDQIHRRHRVGWRMWSPLRSRLRASSAEEPSPPAISAAASFSAAGVSSSSTRASIPWWASAFIEHGRSHVRGSVRVRFSSSERASPSTVATSSGGTSCAAARARPRLMAAAPSGATKPFGTISP